MKKLSYYLILLFGFFFVSLTQKDKPMSLKDLKGVINSEFAFIKAGLVKLDNDTLSVQPFIISEGEITNAEYQTFLNDLLARGETEKYAIATIDTMKWVGPESSNMNYASYYHNHAAYEGYPVVNISKEGAKLYCEWLTERYAQLTPEGQQLIFRLPLKTEWLRAACGDNLDAVYSWGGSYLRNSQGNVLANFVHIGDGAIARDEDEAFEVKPMNPSTSGDYKDVIAPSSSYYPNKYGVYNMNGNVAELLADKDEVIGGSWYDTGYDIRNRSVKKYEGTSPKVGFRIVATIVPSNLEWYKPKVKN